MSIVKRSFGILGKGKTLYRMSFNSFYSTNMFENEIHFANQNIKVQGVKEISNSIQNDYQEYNEKMRQLISGSEETESAKYAIWEKAHTRKNLFKFITIIAIILIILSIIFDNFHLSQGMSWMFSFINLLILLLFITGIVLFIVFKIADKIYEKSYKSYVGGLKGQAANINAGYLNKMNRYHKDIDNLYLMSLDPAHRELVLMRREQQQQHREQMWLQQAHNKEMLEEQRRARQAQEELLEIEKMREERYRKW